MADVVFITVLLAFFALAVLFVAACDRLIGPDEEAFADRAAGTAEQERRAA
jgi:hypothetical protein